MKQHCTKVALQNHDQMLLLRTVQQRSKYQIVFIVPEAKLRILAEYKDVLARF